MLVVATVWLGATLGLWQLHRTKRVKHDYHYDLLACGALALATVGFFWRLLFSSNVWMPVGGGDLVSFLYPVYNFAGRSLTAGDLPLWNPYLYGGAPFAGDNQSGLFYPINLAVFFLRSPLDYRAMEWMSVAHIWLAGVCAYLGLRYIGRPPLRRWAALTGAAAFMFSDLFVTHFGNLNMIASAAWLPLVFSLFRRALEEERPTLAGGAGLFLGISALAGHIQPVLYTILALGLYFLYHMYRHRLHGWRALLERTLLLALTMIVAFGIAAPALLPNYEMSRLTLRAGLTYEDASQYSLPPAALVGLAVPGIFGRGPRGHWAPWPRVEVGYVGILPLLLAGLALLLRRDSLTRFLALLAALATLLAFGDFAILHGWLYRLVPGFDMIRAPARFIYLLDFALAGLAALGLEALSHPVPRFSRHTWRQVLRFSPLAVLVTAVIVLPVSYATLLSSQDKAPEILARVLAGTHGIVFALLLFGCGVAVVQLRGRRSLSHSSLGLIAAALVVFDLASLGAYTELEFNDPTAGFQHPAAITFLKNDPDYYRIDTRTEVWDVWQPNLSLLYGVFDVWGIYNPLILADYHRYWEGLGSRSTRLYDFLNAKYVVGHKDVVLDWEKFELAFDGDPTVNIFRNTEVLPRAFVVHNAWSVPDQEHAWSAVHQADFDPSTTVVVEHGETLSASTPGTSQAEIVSYSNNDISLLTSTSAPGYLVVSEVYYPGWKVEVDGRPAELMRANYAFWAVYLTPGTHQIHFRFQSDSWKVGTVCGILTWLILAVAALRALVADRRLRAERSRGVGE